MYEKIHPKKLVDINEAVIDERIITFFIKTASIAEKIKAYIRYFISFLNRIFGFAVSNIKYEPNIISAIPARP